MNILQFEWVKLFLRLMKSFTLVSMFAIVTEQQIPVRGILRVPQCLNKVNKYSALFR